MAKDFGFFLSWKETSGRLGTLKSETTPVQVERGGGEKWVGSEHGFLQSPWLSLRVWRAGKVRMTPLLAGGTGRVES